MGQKFVDELYEYAAHFVETGFASVGPIAIGDDSFAITQAQVLFEGDGEYHVSLALRRMAYDPLNTPDRIFSSYLKHLDGFHAMFYVLCRDAKHAYLRLINGEKVWDAIESAPPNSPMAQEVEAFVRDNQLTDDFEDVSDAELLTWLNWFDENKERWIKESIRSVIDIG